MSFAIMPNHFHLLIKEKEEGGIARYLQRVELGYTKYFDAKYAASGAVFQGRYRSVHVKDDRQLMHLSAYIHRNPRELRARKGKEFEYPWSSLQDYTGANRWGGLLATDIIASRFDATPKSNYADFVRTSSVKLLEEEFGN
ncbi:transposase [Candidatus Kaiserbacteria bacterium]|nr:transposase [Candidatus Kaiserbacteria bacterium]